MIRRIFAGFLLALAAVGCNVSEPADPDSEDEVGSSELAVKEGEPCGGFAGVPCDEGLFCNYEIGEECGDGDRQGTCEAPPYACQMQYNPVCGCDGKTYGNACLAAQSEVSVLHTGECK